MLRGLGNLTTTHEKHELFVRNSSFVRDVGVVRGEFIFHFQSLAEY
jgi:hypothetical protein